MSTKIEIKNFDHEGRGLGYLDNKVTFIPNTIPGEIVDVDIIQDKKNYIIGKVNNIITKSDKRVKPRCPFFDKCGGCSFLHINYQDEINVKISTVKDIMKKYAHIDINPEFIKSDKELNYRNKIELKIENNTWGYYNENSHDLISINECLLAKESINNIIKSQDLFNITSGNIIIRSNYNDEIIIKIDTKDEYSIDINELTKDNKIVGIIVNNKLIYGEDYFFERIKGYIFKVNINSFFQINLDILEKISDYLNKEKYQNVVDLYCGVGTLGIMVFKDKVYGIEIIEEAVKDAITNSKINHQDNLYMLGDASKIKEIKDNLDTIIIDPPRSGINDNTMLVLLDKQIQNIIYMSCNPITMARDINILKDKYEIKDIKIFDMFPRTKHVESICVLERKT